MKTRDRAKNFPKAVLSVGMGTLLSLSAGSVAAIAATSPQLEGNRTSASATETAQFPSDILNEAVGKGIVGIILSDDRFTTLATILRVTGLLEVLQQEGPFTIFAPTDEAFANLPETVLENLMKAESLEQLTNLLKYHVVPGIVTSGELQSGEVMTAEGTPINVDVGSDAVMVQDATVIDSDIEAENGVIHVIDKVMVLPE